MKYRNDRHPRTGYSDAVAILATHPRHSSPFTGQGHRLRRQRLTEQSIAAYGRAHHMALPNIEYVLWAIVFGLVVANTLGVPALFRPGVATYEFWLKSGIVLLGVRFVLGDVLKLGGISLVCVIVELTASIYPDDLPGKKCSGCLRS